MPEKLEKELRNEVSANHPTWSKERKDQFVFASLHSQTGWTPTKENRIMRVRHGKRV